ncbi:unnamed protein product [Pleuronectes platessa]|uniref:Uncharacterized protein n=1 Tax=Pleuronectes platessa TaxID=8262 RepID=A0A9N7YRU4_PLEPL|nr:unnamed protein product [Pleuronectes platessa]
MPNSSGLLGLHQGCRDRGLLAEVDSKEGQRSIIVCENGQRNVHPHASLAFSLLHTDLAVEMGHPRFTGRVRSFTSSGPPGPISCLDLACKENSRPSQPDSEVEPSKHTGRTETGGNEECKGGRGRWREATSGEGRRRSSGSLIPHINSDEIAKLGSCRN